MANLTGKHAAKIPGNGGYLAEGPDLDPKQTADKPHTDKHQSGVGGPSDRNNNGVDDSEE